MRKHIYRLKTSTLLILSLFLLAACGGGGGTAPTNNQGGSGDPDDGGTSGTVQISVQLLQDGSDTSSDITSISDTNPGVILVQLTGSEIASQIVNFSSTIGQLSQNTALTDSSGQAEVAITAASTASSAGTITVSVEDQESVQTATLNFEIVSEGVVTSTTFSLNVGLYESGVDLNNLASATQVDSVSTLGSSFFVVEVTDVLSGNPVEGAIVSVSTTAGTLVPSSGQILTNVNGVAAAEISAGGSDPGAAATLVATIAGIDATLNFAFGSVDLEIGRDDNGFSDPDDIAFVNGQIAIASAGTLSAGGTTVLSVVIVSNDADTIGFDTPLTVNFSSACSTSGIAEIDTGITTVNGIAQATYTAAGCEGDDVITATVEESSGISATGTISIEPASVGSIIFSSAAPSTIALLGAGADTSTLTFQVLDTIGLGADGELVTAVLSTTVGGITINGETDGDATGITDSDGNVSFIVQAGSVPASPRLVASVDVSGTPITTVSDSLSINTGQPDNDSFSLSASILNPGGFDFDGFTSTLTIRVADAFNNPVDAKNVSFVTEYGSVGGSCTTAEDGSCSVTWTSQNQRAPLLSSTGLVLSVNDLACDSNADGTADLDSAGATVGTGSPCPSFLVDPSDIDFPGQIFGGRTTILAYADGEESFVDSNGNGLYDAGEPFVDLGEAFLDHNEDGVFGGAVTDGACTDVGSGNSIVSVIDINDIDGDGNTTETIGESVLCADWQEGGAEEEFVDFNDNDIYDRGNGIYNGSLCQEADELNGDCTTELVSVREEIRLNVGGSTPYVTVYDAVGTTQVNSTDLSVDISGGGAATRTFRISDLFNGPLPAGTVFDVSPTTSSCAISGITTFTTADESRLAGHSFQVTVVDSDPAEPGDFGSIDMTVTVPASAGGIVSFPVGFGCVD